MKKSEKGVVHVALHVDDNFRNPEAIDEVIAALKENGLVLKLLEGLQDYLSYKVRLSSNKMMAPSRPSH